MAIAAGLVAFALGSDTAGSGRVPAAFNGLIGLKPTKGRWSTRGVVPACRSLDCVSVLTHTSPTRRWSMPILTGFDEADACSRAAPDAVPRTKPAGWASRAPASSTGVAMANRRRCSKRRSEPLGR